MKADVKRTERGWCGHFIGGKDCHYHRNTLLEHNGLKVVVSTIGRYLPYYNLESGEFEALDGLDRYFETMAFLSKEDDPYNDADVPKKVCFQSEWALFSPDMELEADKMHDAVCDEIAGYMAEGSLAVDVREEGEQ